MPPTTNMTFDYLYQIPEADLCNRALARIGADRIRDTEEDTKQARACRAIYANTRDELLRMNPWNFATRNDLIPEDASYPYEKNGKGTAYIADDRFALTGGTTAGIGTVIGGIGAAVNIDGRLIGRRVTGTAVRVDSTITAVDEVARTVTIDRATTGAASAIYCYIPILKVLEVDADLDAVFVSAGGGDEKRIIADVATNHDDTLGDLLEIKYIRQEMNPDRFDALFTDAFVLRLASKIALTMSQDKGLVQKIEAEFAAIMQGAKLTASEERQVDEPDGWWTDRDVGGGPSTRRRE